LSFVSNQQQITGFQKKSLHRQGLLTKAYITYCALSCFCSTAAASSSVAGVAASAGALATD